MTHSHPHDLNRTIERLALRAWSAFETIDYAGWRLGFAEGYTKRANSVTVLDQVETDLEAKIAYCEAQYQARQQPPIFRLLSFTNPVRLDSYLSERGYQLVDPSYVMGCSLIGRSHTITTSLHSESLDDWLAAFYQLNGGQVQSSLHHRQILAAIESKAIFALLHQQQEVVACGIGVLENGYLGIFDLFTHPTYRRCGHATVLMQGILQWGIAQGAEFSYLQVVQSNAAACKLYKKLGYQIMYEYWYRVL
ncbi:MAG: hypothetical protein Kow00121_03640 [Elainellaceae cyanobacterium]